LIEKGKDGGFVRKKDHQSEAITFAEERVCSGFRAEALVAVLANHVFLFVVSFGDDMGMQQGQHVSTPMALDLPSAEELKALSAASFFSIHNTELLGKIRLLATNHHPRATSRSARRLKLIEHTAEASHEISNPNRWLAPGKAHSIANANFSCFALTLGVMGVRQTSKEKSCTKCCLEMESGCTLTHEISEGDQLSWYRKFCVVGATRLDAFGGLRALSGSMNDHATGAIS
jgi:hypothetical protein